MPIKSVLICLGLGVLYAQSFAPDPFPPIMLPWLNVFVLAALAHRVVRANSVRSATREGLLFGLGTFVSGLYWLVISMNIYGGMPLALAIIALVLFAGYLALFPALCSLLVRWLWPNRPKTLSGESIFWLAFIWAAGWTMSEWLRATLFTGFAWLNTAAGQTDGWLAGWSAWVGPYGVTFLTAWVAASLSASLASTAKQGGESFRGKQSAPLLIAGLICAVGALIGPYRFTSPAGEPLVIRLVQGDIDQASKFTEKGFDQAVELYQSLSAHKQESQSVSPDLIMLPETVMTYPAHRVPPHVWADWIEIARDRDAILMMGGPMRGLTSQDYTNSIFTITPSDSVAALINSQVYGRYDKQHLVPFGEFVPWGFRWFVDMMNIPLGDFTAGEANQLPIRIGQQKIAPNICYEDVFAQELLPSVRDGATILANFSNLGWFGNSSALRQHWQMSRLRAMETQRPMVRSTNTGMTGVIDPWGQPIAILPTMTAGYVDVQVQGQSGLTPYVRTGNTPVLVLCILILLVATWRRKKHIA